MTASCTRDLGFGRGTCGHAPASHGNPDSDGFRPCKFCACPGYRVDACPTCGSPQPQLHPSVQHEGETQPCDDPWHSSSFAGRQMLNRLCGHAYAERAKEVGHWPNGPKSPPLSRKQAEKAHTEEVRPMKIYISGGMFRKELDGVLVFRTYAREVKEMGHEAVVPHDIPPIHGHGVNTPCPPGYRDGVACFMRGDLAELLRCDAILMIEDWRNSVGAEREHSVACWTGIRVFYGTYEIPKVPEFLRAKPGAER